MSSGGDVVGLGINPGNATPDVVFGSCFTDAIDQMLKWWLARAALLPEDSPGKGTGGAFRQMVIALGMVALGRYEWLRHQRKAKSATRKTKGGHEAVDVLAEEAEPKSPQEQDAWDAYRHAAAVADALADVTACNRGPRRKRSNSALTS